MCAILHPAFCPVVVDIYSSSINKQINSTIFDGRCVVLHGKDTLFYSEKQATNKQQKGSLAPFQNIRQFVMNKGSGDDRDITREGHGI